MGVRAAAVTPVPVHAPAPVVPVPVRVEEDSIDVILMVRSSATEGSLPCRKRSFAPSGRSHRPEAVSLREDDILVWDHYELYRLS